MGNEKKGKAFRFKQHSSKLEKKANKIFDIHKFTKHKSKRFNDKRRVF